jgi:hypothetical protein
MTFPESVVGVIPPDTADTNIKTGMNTIKHGVKIVTTNHIAYLRDNTIPKALVKSAMNMFLLKQQMKVVEELEYFEPEQSEYEDEMQEE